MEGAPKQADRVNIVAIIIIGMIGALVVYASFTALQAFYNAEAGKLEMQRDIEGRSIALREFQAQQQGDLTEYRMLEKRNQIVGLPIERAMQLVIQDVRSGNAGNLVPAVGPHDTPTAPVPVVNDVQATEEPPPTEPATPSEGTEGAVPAEGAAAPAGGAGDQGAAPAGGAAPAPAAPAGGATPAPAAPAPGGNPAAGQGAAAGNPTTVAPAATPAANPGGAPAGAQ